MKLSLVIHYVGLGKKCGGCGRQRETTHYVLRQGETLLQEFLICDACQDKGYIVDFEPKVANAYAPKDRRRRIKISRQLEAGVARDIGGKVQPGSGNQDAKADIRKMDEWRVEHKYTDGTSSFRLLVEDLAAIVRHANLAGEWPALVLNFRTIGRKFAIIPYELFTEIVEHFRG